MNARILVLSILLLAYISPAAAKEKTAFNPGKVDFTVQIGELETNYSVLALFVMPGEDVRFRSSRQLVARVTRGYLDRDHQQWRWIAPAKPGLYPIELRHNGQVMTLNMFVLRLASEMKNGYLGNYHIGEYQKQPFKGLAVYRAPAGFVEVTQANQNTRVSPHFTLKQFLCKQRSTWPKYVILRPELLIKLEQTLEKINHAGIRTDSFVVMSGYRTPWYNRSIGNRTSSSRHLYGGAADIYIDVNPVDDVMDDLNGDGRLNKADADYLYDLFEKWSDEPWWYRHIGGLASYGANHVHGAFVHIDARGYKARWGR